jgi:hydrogenase maturation protein HypF
MQAAHFNAPLASSMGRLFDAAGAIILGEGKVTQEVQLAIGLENLAKNYALAGTRGYDFKINQKTVPYILDPLPMFRQIVKALNVQEAGEKVAFRMHLTVATMIKQTCLLLKKKSAIKQVVLSGGVFQNELLLRLTKELLKQEFCVFVPEKLPASDAAISLGQAMIGCFRSKKCV